MKINRVVITGIGVLSSNGIGKDAFFEAITKGASGIKPVSLFDTSEFKAKTAGEITDFRPQDFLGDKGLRNLDRSTRLISSAVKLALSDASLEASDENSRDIGIVTGATFGSLKSISDFDRDAIKDGPYYVNPALFPNTVINSPSSQASIKFNIKGLNATISTGFCASLDAISYAFDFIRLGRIKIILSGGVEELCEPAFIGFYKCGLLAGSKKDHPEVSCPFDRRRNGVIFGEGACMLALESLDSAIQRKAKIYAEVRGFGSSFEPFRMNKYNTKGTGLAKAMEAALKNAGIGIDKIDCIYSGANSTEEGDLLETLSIKKVFGTGAKNLYISAIKSMLGECYSASGALQAAGAVCAIEKKLLSPTINYQEKDALCDLNYVSAGALSHKAENVLINAFGPNGCNSSLVISRFV